MFEFVLIAALVAYANGENYCDSSLCNGAKHIACGNSGSFSSSCASDRQLVSITPYIDMILSKHNEYRNTVAAGKLRGFSSAVRMGTMMWDNDLAYLAELNVKQCTMQHDQCHNTAKYKWSGQNLAWYWSMPAATPQTAIQNGIEGWFNEYKDASMKDINTYKVSSGVIGHFTPMVNDRSIRVGCAFSHQSKNGGKESFFACNYSQTNIMGLQVYTSGPTASKCQTKNSKYPALCGPNEPIDPNSIY